MAEGDLQSSPMDGMRPPQLPEQPVDVVRAEHLTRLLRTCEGCDFPSRRDTAIILLLVDTGMRRAECVGMTLDDVDLDQRIVWVLGKSRRPRALPIGRKTARVAKVPDLVAITAWLNGMLGARFDVAGAAAAVSLVVEDGRITRIYAVANPHKLGWLEKVAELRR